MFRGIDRASPERYAKDLLADPVIAPSIARSCSGCSLGLAFPFGLGVALTGTIIGGLTGMLWGGAVRILFLHHATFSINSLCHFFGRRRFRREMSRATSRGSRYRPSARHGTTTTTPSRPPLTTASPAGSWTPAVG